MVLGGRDGTAQPMARGDMEQFQVVLDLQLTLKRSLESMIKPMMFTFPRWMIGVGLL